MMRQYLVQIRDKNNYAFLADFGYIIHVTKLKGIVVLEADEHMVQQIECHPEVVSIRPSDTFAIAK